MAQSFIQTGGAAETPIIAYSGKEYKIEPKAWKSLVPSAFSAAPAALQGQPYSS